MAQNHADLGGLGVGFDAVDQTLDIHLDLLLTDGLGGTAAACTVRSGAIRELPKLGALERVLACVPPLVVRAGTLPWYLIREAPVNKWTTVFIGPVESDLPGCLRTALRPAAPSVFF
jgi:hypothetical protein